MKKGKCIILVLLLVLVFIPHQTDGCTMSCWEQFETEGIYVNDAKKLCGPFEVAYTGHCDCESGTRAVPKGWRQITVKKSEDFILGFQTRLTEAGKQKCAALGYAIVNENIGKRTVWGYLSLAPIVAALLLVVGGIAPVLVAIIGFIIVAQRKRYAKIDEQSLLAHQKRRWHRLLWVGIVGIIVGGILSLVVTFLLV